MGAGHNCSLFKIVAGEPPHTIPARRFSRKTGTEDVVDHLFHSSETRLILAQPHQFFKLSTLEQFPSG